MVKRRVGEAESDQVLNEMTFGGGVIAGTWLDATSVPNAASTHFQPTRGVFSARRGSISAPPTDGQLPIGSLWREGCKKKNLPETFTFPFQNKSAPFSLSSCDCASMQLQQRASARH